MLEGLSPQAGGDLLEIITSTTFVARKGPAIGQAKKGDVTVIEVYAMPHVSEIPPEMKQVDVHFLVVVVDPVKVEPIRQRFTEIMGEWIKAVPIWKKGPSYLHVGGMLGSQEMAFRLFGLGEVLGYWRVVTPERLGIEGPFADLMAGMGYVLVEGLTSEGLIPRFIEVSLPEAKES